MQNNKNTIKNKQKTHGFIRTLSPSSLFLNVDKGISKFLYSSKTKYRNRDLVCGFTLIETLVAITILLIGVVTPLQIASNALYSTFHSRDQITAYYLAAEAIEYVKNVRDTKFLSDITSGDTSADGWMVGLEECTYIEGDTPKFCIIDAHLPVLSDESIETCDEDVGTACDNPLLLDTGSGMWSYDSGDVTRFSRKVSIVLRSNNSNGLGGTIDSDGNMIPPNYDEAIIDVVVNWVSKGSLASQSFSLKGVMMNWQRI